MALVKFIVLIQLLTAFMSEVIPASKEILAKSSDSLLSAYIKDVNCIKSLDREVEVDLASRFKKTGDIEIANQLVTSQLKLVVRIAYTYKNYGISMMDIIAEGNLGLMHAVKKFDPDSGFRLSTYASWWIKAYINTFVLRSWSVVRIGTTSLQKRIFFNLAKIKKRLGLSASTALTAENARLAADYFGGTVEEVMGIDTRISSPDISLNKRVRDDSSGAELGDSLTSDIPNPEELAITTDEASKRMHMLKTAIESLSDRERLIFCGRNLSEDKLTLDDLSKQLGRSKERIRQIEERCFEKIKKHMLEIQTNTLLET